ncbi:flagellin (plasmid) [Natrialbaceae archaeon A-arb3/5]
MASVSATHLIMFIGSLVLASAVAGTVIMEVGQVSDSIETRGSNVAQEIETEVAIISDETQPDAMLELNEDESSGESDVYNVTVLVKNIGNEDLVADPQTVDALVDGSYATVTAVERVDADDTTWRTGGVAEITIPNRELDGDSEVTIIVSGNEDTINFHVGDGDNGDTES